jgi:hypothetical protein
MVRLGKIGILDLSGGLDRFEPVVSEFQARYEQCREVRDPEVAW